MKKKSFALLILGSLMLLLAGCGGQKSNSQSTSSKASTTATTQRTFTDSVGRKVKLPQKITKIAPSGPL